MDYQKLYEELLREEFKVKAALTSLKELMEKRVYQVSVKKYSGKLMELDGIKYRYYKSLTRFRSIEYHPYGEVELFVIFSAYAGINKKQKVRLEKFKADAWDLIRTDYAKQPLWLSFRTGQFYINEIIDFGDYISDDMLPKETDLTSPTFS
jgi:hypothetical protein